jgi:adenylate kinase family enzyme
MAVIQVPGQSSGKIYSINIAGTTPTPQEQERISQFISQREADFEIFSAERFGAPLVAEPEAPVEEDDGTAFGRGLATGVQSIRSLLGTSVEEAGRGLGFEGVQEFGRGMETAAEQRLRELQEETAPTRLEDVEGVGTALTYAGEVAGQQAPILATTLAGAGAGAAVGSAFFGIGAGPGAIIGGALASFPLLFGGNVQRQEEQVAAGELENVDIQRALIAAGGQSAIEGIAGRILALAPLRPGVGSLWARAGKGAATGAATEVPTEITQLMIERAQAGLPIDSDDAIKEYFEAGVAALILGGPIGAVGGVAQRDVAPQELDQDLKELAAEGAARFQFAEQTEREIEEARAKSLAAAGIDPDAPLGLDAPDVPLALPAPQDVDVAPETTIADDEFANLSFDKAQYERVLQQVKADITSGKPINIPAIQQRVKSDIPGTKVSQVRDIMNELKARGFVAENPASKKNKFIAMGSLAPEVKTPDVSYRRQIDSAADFIKADQTRLERLQYDLRSAEAYGRDLEGNRVTPNQVNATISRVEQRIAENQQRIEASNQRLQSLGQDTHVPRFEKVGLPPGLKAVPVAEGTPDALRPRFEAQQASIRGMKEQLNSVNRQVRKLNDQAKKRTLSSNELDRMQKLQEQQAEVSTRLGEAQANLKTPEKIFQEAKGEQFREQERQREIERKLAAARARAAADQVKAQEDQGVSPVTPAFNAKQTRVFDALKKRLTNLGLKDVKLEGVQKIEGAEGMFDPVTKTITLSMGMYDPNMNDQQLFDAISEVMNHEVIHALRAMGVLKPNEMKVLERLAEKTKFVKRTKEGTQKRNYTYLDRAKKLYPDFTPTQQKEEAIAEMFRDYTAGRLKLGGGPRALFEKIKKFFKSLIGANVDEGFTRVEDIFQGIRRGEIGARDRVAPAAPAPTPAAAPAQMQSRLAGMPKNIADAVNDLDLFLRKNPSKSEIENHPAILRIVEDMSSRPETVNNPNYGSASWHSNRSYEVSGVPVVGTGRLLPIIVEEAIRLPYVETGTSLSMPERGRKAFVLIGPPAAGKSTIANELAIANKAAIPDADQVKSFIPEYAGGIGAAAVHEESVELLAEAQKRMVNEGYNLVAQKVGHSDKSIRNLIKSLKESDYDVSLVNMHVDPDEAFRRMIGRFIRTGRIVPPSYFNSIGNSPRLVYNKMKEEGIADGYAEIDNNGGLNEAKRILDISGKNPLSGSQFDPERGGARTEQSFARTRQPETGRVVPQTAREQLNAAVSTSDDYMPDAPAEERPLFSRLPRSPMVAGLREFIKNNPDGFTIDSTTFDPAAGGFVVAPLKEAEIIVGESLPEEVLLGYLEDNKDIARASGRTVYLGGWFDGESQQYFLDNTLIVPTAEEALYIAEAADQLAIFDLNNFEEIRTNAGIEQLKQSGSYRRDAAVGYQRNLAEIGRRFAEARDQRRARIQEQLIGGLERPRQSRLTVPMTAEQRAASIIDYLNPNTGKPLFKKKPGSETLVSFANKLLELRGTRPYNILTSEEDRQAVAQIMAAEAEAALLSSRDALGWYDSTLKLAKQILYPVYPEVSPTRPDGTANPMYEPAAEHAFDYATAVTSNGMAVVDNYQFAAEQYDAWKASTDGKFPVVGKGDQGGSMLKAFEFWNALTDLGYDSNAISELLMTQLPRSEVNNLLKDVFGVRTLKELPAVADTEEEAGTIVSVAYVIGPKIGNGFYQNLRGNFDPLTMDRWWMRFVNRITGNPLAIQTEESIASSVDRLWQLVSKPRSLTKMERDILRRAQENLNMTKLEKSDIALLSAEVEKVWNKYFFNKAQNDKLRDLLNEGMDFEIVGGSVRGPEAELAKRLAREARPEKPELALAATNLAKKVKPALEEAPRNARDRTAMRDVANRAREILRRDLGAELTNADFQALMWYAEKRIFNAGGVKRGRGEDNDYADGAIAIAKAKGISDAKIEAALPEAERGRVSGVKSQLAGDQDAGGRVGELVREPQEGDFFSPRRLTLVAESDSIEANMTPQERAEVREALQGAEIDPEMPRQMYSRIPVAESYMPTRAPVDSKAGPTPIYGSIMEEGRLLPVVLPKGSHRVYENGVEVGNGLFHIQQRQHDRELIENSKYKRVENAIYDLMRRWQNQGYDDGESVIGYNIREGLVLEWRNNLAFSAPPMRLVLERGSNVRGAPLRDAYYVKTFFPILEKKNRATQPQRGRALVNEVRGDSRRMLSRLYSTTSPTQGTPQFGPSDLETAMQNMRYAGVQDKFASIFKKIGKPFKVDEKAIEDGTQWVFNKLQDNFVSVGKMYDALRKQGANIPRDMDAYFQELLMHGVTGAKKTNFKAEEFTPVVERVARLNVTDTERDALKRVSGYYDQILEKTGNKSHALTNAYLYALHALERNQRISELSKGQITNGSGMSNQEAQNIIAFANSMDAQRAAELRNIAAAVQGMISGTNDTYIEGGLIPDYKDDADVDDKTRQAFTKYKNYVPLRGFADPESDLDVSAGGFSTTNRFGALGSPNKKALGRESYAGDILANVAVQRENAIDKAERNKVGVAVLNLLESDVNTDAYAEVLLRHPLRRVMRNGRITVMPDRDFSNPDLPILAVRRGGEEVLIGFKDPRLAAAFKGTSAKQMNAVMSGLHSFTRLYANLLTSWNPAFLLGNWPRDIETALFNAQQYNMEGSSKDIIKNVGPSFKAIMKVLNNKEGADPYWANRYKQFYDNGGQNVLNQMGDVVNNSKDIRDTISKIVTADEAGNRILTKALWTSTKKGVGSLANYVEGVNTAVENSTRLAFFDAVVRNLEAQGVPTERALREAAVAARQLTTNFAKGGEMKTAFNTFYLFFNASLQGSMAIFTSLVNNPKGRKLVAGVITAGFVMELLNGAISGDEDDDGIKDYDNLGDYKLSHSIVLPDLNGDGTFVSIPLAYGINMFYNFGRVMGNMARGAMGDGGTYTPQEAAASTVGTVVESFNPFGGNNFWTFAAPTQLDLPVELMTNRNFMDGPIYKELSPFEQYKSRSSLYWSTTSPSAVWVSKFINDNIGGGSDIIPGEVLGKRVDIQPDVIEHIIDFMLGGAGKFVLQMGEAATTYAPAAMMGDFEEDMIRRTPILNKFLTAVTEKDRSGDFYEKRDDVLAVYADLKDAIDNGDRERALAIRERYAEYLPLIGPIRSINNEIRKLNTLRRNVNANASLSQERKREILDRLEERIAAYVSRGNQLMLSI